MILANLTRAIREQNYYAVVLEFLIVIAGVVIGFQIQGWSEYRQEQAQLDRLLLALSQEMQENRIRLEDYIEAVETDVERQQAFIAWMAASDSEESLTQYETIFQLLPVAVLALKQTASEQLQTSSLALELKDRQLLDLIEQWERLEAEVLRSNQDLLRFRNDYAHILFAENISVLNVIEYDPLLEFELPQSKFGGTLNDIRNDRRFENIAAMKIGLGGGSVALTRQLIGLSETISALKQGSLLNNEYRESLMIFANLTKAIREQNWFAVVVEFLIVIAGVVIGFQIQGWNENRQERREAERTLVMIVDEMVLLDHLSDMFAQYYETTTVYGEAALMGWNNPDAMSDSAFIVSAYQASQIVGGSNVREIRGTLLGSDAIRHIDDEDLLQRLRRFFSGSEAFEYRERFDTDYRRNIRRAMPHGLQDIIRSECGDIRAEDANFIILPETCDVVFDPDIARETATILRSRTDLRDDLRWHLASSETGLFDNQTRRNSNKELVETIEAYLQ